jgi:hypothetical protein
MLRRIGMEAFAERAAASCSLQARKLRNTDHPH